MPLARAIFFTQIRPIHAKNQKTDGVDARPNKSPKSNLKIYIRLKKTTVTYFDCERQRVRRAVLTYGLRIKPDETIIRAPSVDLSGQF